MLTGQFFGLLMTGGKSNATSGQKLPARSTLSDKGRALPDGLASALIWV